VSEAAPHLLVDLQRPGLTDQGVDRVLRSLRVADGSPGPRFGSIRLLLHTEDRKRCASLLEAAWHLALDADPIAAANLSMSAAAAEGAPLLVLSGASSPSEQSLMAMARAIERDPYFAFVLPRVSAFGEEFVAKLDADRGDPMLAMIPVNAIRALPELHLVPDQLSSAVLIRSEVVRDFEALDPEYSTLWGGIRDLIARARRVGFRCVVANRALVAVPDASVPRDSAAADLQQIHRRYPEVYGLDEEWKHAALHEYESLLGRACSASSELRKTLLIDLSDLGASYNGTSEAVIGLLWGLKGCRSDWKISLLVSPEVARFHGFERDFPEFPSIWPDAFGRFTAVFRPIQPWSLPQLERLHHLGLFNFVMMFDTILNEIHVGAPPGLDKVWELLAKTADGLLYISRFTRDRFRTRFPLDESVDECVSHLSFHPGDYCPKPHGREGDFIFVVGNHYSHKWMEATIADLVDAFPYQRFNALGYDAPHIPQLSGLESGHAGQHAVDRLYSDARVIVYPSQYEGFGFPVIRGLSHGKTVIARSSELLEELAACYRGPGRLLAFETRTELVELLGRELHDLEVDPLPLGTELAPGAEPDSHVEIAARVLAFIENRTAKPSSSNWARRQAIFETAALYRAT